MLFIFSLFHFDWFVTVTCGPQPLAASLFTNKKKSPFKMYVATEKNAIKTLWGDPYRSSITAFISALVRSCRCDLISVSPHKQVNTEKRGSSVSSTQVCKRIGRQFLRFYGESNMIVAFPRCLEVTSSMLLGFPLYYHRFRPSCCLLLRAGVLNWFFSKEANNPPPLPRNEDLGI